jgi:type I restriction enzyme S subunit
MTVIRGISGTKSQIMDFLARRFPQNSVAPDYFGDLLSTYKDSGLAPPNLVTEITSGDDGKLWAHVWEALLYHHLLACGYDFRRDRVRKSGQHGPDFGIVHNGQTIWIEAITPSPEGIPQDWLDPPKQGECKVRTKPHEQMLLRWTSALKAKRDKLKCYLEQDIIAPTDCTVIAVNSCRLSDFAVEDLGISQLPFAIEAVFPIGPIAVPISVDGRPDGDAIRIPRYVIQKSNGAPISTANFLDPCYANVSAVIGGYQREMLKGVLYITLVHNPLATARLPRGLLCATNEYVADQEGDHFIVRRI